MELSNVLVAKCGYGEHQDVLTCHADVDLNFAIRVVETMDHASVLVCFIEII